MQSEFVDLFDALGPIIHSYLEQYACEEARLLWFLVNFTDRDETSVEVLMDYLPI
jgi:hypothetical protein